MSLAAGRGPLSYPSAKPQAWERPSDRFERGRSVTIIAGFPTKGFVVLGADGEEGTNQEKSAVKKIAHVHGDGYSCLIGGAGDGDFIDLAVQEAREALQGEPSNVDSSRVRSIIEEIVTDIHTDRLDNIPNSDSIELLCAIWTSQDPQPQLVKVARGVSLIRDRPEAIGIGAYLARYLIETLQLDGQMECRHWERLCAYILQKAKAHVQFCGGPSQVVVLDSSGHVKIVPQAIIVEDEDSTSLVMDKVRWLFNWSDPVGWQADLQKMEEVVDWVAERIKVELANHLEEIRARDVIRGGGKAAHRSPTHGRKDPPPSPESP